MRSPGEKGSTTCLFKSDRRYKMPYNEEIIKPLHREGKIRD